ncbi:hypothetical protein [Prochlorococcus marinus]|uniref:hypothetical protein n=1 Tax=Prochlorococcus marinus TaxID=1219 RepID=UPI001AD9683A|nr:hypothetical protein [Prochlorococcus marinus]MBO8204246.1 hypothetical protein [Prochlorococcus marinus CUG1415]MBW3043547.1 hypothetical protein [Prochlorococcus marinus str. MU1415]
MNLIYKKQLKIKKLIFVFLFILNPLLLNAIANTKYADKSEINKKIIESNEDLNTDSKLINEAINEAKELIPSIDDLVENVSVEEVKINTNYEDNEELKKIKKEDDFLKNDNLDNKALDLSNSKKDSIQRKKIIIDLNETTIDNKALKENYLPTPTVGDISVGEFEIPTRGYVKLNPEKLSLNLVKADALETLKLISKISGYGMVIIENPKEEEKNESEDRILPLITVNFNNVDISDVFNSILMASGLQAKIEKNIIFVGENIFNKSLIPKVSKTYRLNQANAASVGDYLATLGARISKVLLKGSSVDGEELGDSFVTKAEWNETFINSYGTQGGPLQGLLSTVDLRLQTITLIGTNDLILTAEKYIKSLDVRHRQVALSIKIIDVSLTKNDTTNNVFDLTSGSTYLINNGGLAILTGNQFARVPSGGAVDASVSGTALGNNNFANWIEMKIKNENAKIMASPTLILGENADAMVSGVASATGGLDSAAIGRPFANEGFVKVGETVTVSYDVSTEDGVTTCAATPGTAGITFGAKVDKIDDNGYVTFSLSPAISAVTKTETVGSCGTASTLSVRKLDTGSIRVKNGNTLILTGVLKDEDNVTTTKTPLLGDIPILGRLFRKNSTVKRKSELIILVTPRILND